MKRGLRDILGRMLGGVVLAAGVAAVFLYKVKPVAEPEDTTVRPIKSLVVGAETGLPKLYFPGTVEAHSEVDLSFEVGGRLIEFPVRRGQVVQQGERLGRLDPSNYENQVKNAEADLERARSSLERIELALAANAVSKEEHSQAKAAVQKAEAQVAIQRKALADTVLTASFAGRVSDTYADLFDSVAPGRAVLKLQDMATLAITVSIPQGYVLLATPARFEAMPFRVEVDGMPGVSCPATVKEYATTADPVTQTYRVTFSFQNPGATFLLPGMTGTVVVDRDRPGVAEPTLRVPADAVGFTSAGEAFVWRLSEQGDGICAAQRQTIELGQRDGERLEVLNGLTAGTRIAAAGVAILTEGRRVRPLTETADRRPEDGP